MGSTDTNGTTDVYLRDLATNTTSLVSVNPQGTKAGNGTSVTPAFSPDGTAVSFTSDASDLGATDANGVFDVYLRDLSARTTHLVSSNTAGVAASGDSERPVFSPDGSQVAFLSTAGDMGPTDSNGQFDVYLQDLASHTNRLVSANSSGTDASDGTSGRFATFVFLPEFSPDGTRILFPSDGTDLVPADKDDLPDLFVRDLSAGTTSVVTANPDGTGTVGLSFDSAEGSPTDLTGDPAFDQTGTHVVFVSAETGFGPQDTNLSNDVYVRDLVAGTTQLVSSNAADSDAGNGASGSPVFLTGSRLRIAFASFGSNLGPEDVNGSMDVYLATQVP
jgi:Tol biopolymer transport system component